MDAQDDDGFARNLQGHSIGRVGQRFRPACTDTVLRKDMRLPRDVKRARDTDRFLGMADARANGRNDSAPGFGKGTTGSGVVITASDLEPISAASVTVRPASMRGMRPVLQSS